MNAKKRYDYIEALSWYIVGGNKARARIKTILRKLVREAVHEAFRNPKAHIFDRNKEADRIAKDLMP